MPEQSLDDFDFAYLDHEYEKLLRRKLGRPAWLELHGLSDETIDRVLRRLAKFLASALTEQYKRAPRDRLVAETKVASRFFAQIRDFQRQLHTVLDDESLCERIDNLMHPHGSTAALSTMLDAAALAAWVIGPNNAGLKGKAGAPAKDVDQILIADLCQIVTKAAESEGEPPLLPWDKRGARTAETVSEFLRLVNIRVTPKTIRNQLSRPKNPLPRKSISRTSRKPRANKFATPAHPQATSGVANEHTLSGPRPKASRRLSRHR